MDDIVGGLLTPTRSGKVGEAFNLASGKETTVISLAHQINELAGNLAGTTFTPRRKWDTHLRCYASGERAKGLIGYDPATDFRSGLERTVAWFKNNWPMIQALACS